MDIQLIHYFVEVVKSGGFTKAAGQLKIPKSTLSKAVTKLEQETGTKLLIRTTRKQTLTQAGKVFYEKCLGPIKTIEEAQKELYGHDNIVSGTVKFTCPEDIETIILPKVLSKLTKKYPDLKLKCESSNKVKDLVGEGFDFAIRVGNLKESNLKVRKIGLINAVFVAKKSYLKENPINSLDELEKAKLITISTKMPYLSIPLKKGSESRTVKLYPTLQSDLIMGIYNLALAGAGVTLLPTYLCQNDIKSGKLVTILDDWKFPQMPISIVSPLSTVNSPRLKIITDEIIQILQEALEN